MSPRRRPAEGAAVAAAPAPPAHPRADDIGRLVAGELRDPHSLLGAHPEGGGVTVRVWRPDADAVVVRPAGGGEVPLGRVHDAGLFEGELPAGDGGGVPAYSLDVAYGEAVYPVEDPYRFLPTLGELDLHLMGEGRHEDLWRHMGAHVRTHEGAAGTSFAVWAPNARSVRVVGDFNSWDGRLHPMRQMGSSGIWELFLPGVGTGARYKYEVLTAQGHVVLKADPFAFAMEPPPGTASVVFESSYEWGDGEWMEARRRREPTNCPMSVYECHLGSWRRCPDEGDRPLTYRELAEQLPDYLADLGFTHVEFLPVAEHPFTGSWGYQVSAYYAPTARHGTPDDFRALVDALHRRGIGVIVDWVPAHFPKDDFALARFDGTALFEHVDPRKGEHPDWGTLVFNFGRHEVRNFLLANALYWVKELHVDGLRVDAVASMLYLDYSRQAGEWVPNQFGGNENLEAVEFVKEVNAALYGHCPGAMTIAEESTAWPGVSRPVHLGGLGFGFKWNMGWMHDTLSYFSKDPVFRRYHHNQLTFGLMYAWSENFVLSLSHDEVVHMKGSLLTKMPGDRWQQLANLRALFAWMWAHPGKQLVFMGAEIAQEREWDHDRSLDWHVLEWDGHRGVQNLMRELNRLYLAEPALWERDFSPEGFAWIDANDSDNSVLSFVRYGATPATRPLACVANLTPVVRDSYRIGLPRPGRWEVALNTDDGRFAGSGTGPGPSVEADPVPWHGHPQSAQVTLPPLGVVWLAPA